MLQIKSWLVFGFISLFGAGSAIAAMQIEMTPKPNPPEAGENSLMIVLKDDAGKPIENAKVDLLIFMPAMGTMPRMDEKAKVTAKGSGVYEARFDLSMGGTWEITLNAEKEGEKSSAHYSITTGIPGVERKGGGKAGSQGTSGSTPLDVGPERLQMIGVRFAEAKTVAMQRDIEAVGVVEQDQTHREELTLRYSGYIVKQFRGRVGDLVKAGDPLFSVYSPDLVTAQSEFLLADRLSEGGHSLHKAAGEKLKNLGLSERDIAQIRKDQQPRRDIVVRSPIKGTILDILVREGASVAGGQVLYIIGDLSKTYIVARVFQQEVGHVKVGQKVMIGVPGAAAGPIQGKVDLIYPQIEQGAGTANVRVEVGEVVSGLKPGVYVDVSIPVELGSLLTIPAEAILYSGRHRYVFVDHGEGRLEPREVWVGRSADGRVQIVDGLKEGERVAASGTFLLGSEAQLRSALPKWKDETKKTETQATPKEPSTPKADMMNLHNGHGGESK
jgi:Cu(I)/Ag(I) efflux system membrane fusion protein